MPTPITCLTQTKDKNFEGYHYMGEKEVCIKRFSEQYPEKTLLGAFETSDLNEAIRMLKKG